MMKNYSYKDILNKRGAVMVLFAILLPVLFGFVGFGFDVGLLYMQKGKLQDIADATALAGAAHLGEKNDAVAKAVADFAKANGLDVNENSLVEVDSGGWNSLAQLGDNEELRVAYGVVTVDNKERLRVRIDKRVKMPFVAVLTSAWDKGLPVAAVAAAEGGAVEVPPYRIIGRNGVYDNFFDLTNGSENMAERWIDGSVYAGNLLRVSYKQNEPQKAMNMFSVNGYIFADRLNTGLPLINGVYKDSDGMPMERIFRSSYVRKKDGDKSLYGYDALSPTNMVVPGWGCTAAKKAEDRLRLYSRELNDMIDSDIKHRAIVAEGNNRYMCNQGVYENLIEELQKKLHKDRDNQNEWKNKQYSNIVVDDKEIDTLYVEIQGDKKDIDLKDSRDAAIWLGAWPYADNIRKVGRIIVELHSSNSLTRDNDLTGSFIINLGHNGEIEIGPIYSQANLIVRAVYNGDTSNYIKFTDVVYSDKILSFSYDEIYGGKGLAHHKFSANTVLAADLVLFGYGYDIGPNVVTPNLNTKNNVQTHHYDDLTNYISGAFTPEDPENSNWWKDGITSIDYVVVSGNPVFDLDGLKLSTEEEIQKNANAELELSQLKLLWGSVDKEHRTFVLPTKVGGNKNDGTPYDLYGSLYGELGRWPTEINTQVGTDNKGSYPLNCPMESIPGIESVSGKLRLVE